MASMINDLLDPKYLPDKTEKVSLIQTHISLVYLADEFVYKIKKPVNFGFLDFSTLKNDTTTVIKKLCLTEGYQKVPILMYCRYALTEKTIEWVGREKL